MGIKPCATKISPHPKFGNLSSKWQSLDLIETERANLELVADKLRLLEVRY